MGKRDLGFLLGVLFVGFVTLLAGPAGLAASPAAATLTPTSAPAIWHGTATGGATPNDATGLGLFGSEDLCQEGINCEVFTLTVSGAPADWAAAKKLLHVHLGWTIPTQDFDLYIHKGTLAGPVVASSGNGATNGILTSEDADLDPTNPIVGTGVFAVHVVYYNATQADQYTGTASVIDVPPPPPPPPSQEPAGTPRFYSYLALPGVADFAGEPSIGANRKSERSFNGIPNGGTVTYFGGFLPYMLRATFNDGLWPPKVTWEKAALTVATAPRVYGDPILFTDGVAGRTFVAQEMGLTPAGSTMEWTDNDGGSFTPSEGSGAPSGVDHETVGGGPFHQPLPTGANPLYPNGVWYCSQTFEFASCALSFDGGTTFGPSVPIYTGLDCSGIHGHIKIGPDGTAYVPNAKCTGKQAVVVSEDNGLTWSVRRIPTSAAGDRDPSVAVGSDNTIYFAYENSDGRSHVAVSRDKGLTWDSDTDVGAQLGIKNSLFHAAVAGDGDRAAITFFGTTTGGTDYDQPGFTGDWYLYVATTYDRGHTWWTQNVTPGDPIQRGGICTTGACRNLLDFFGADVDREGRVLIGYDDGCISNACITGRRSFGLPGGNDFTAKGAIARQTGGKRMYAAFDPPAGPVAEPPARPLPPPAISTCDGLVATDSTGDAGNPVLSATGSADQLDITALNFAQTADKQSITTTITLKNFSTTPAPGTAGAIYRVIWTSAKRNADGSLASTSYATEATTDPTGSVAYKYGTYDAAGNAFTGTAVTATGSFTTGVNGTLNVTVPLSFLGNPTIPVTDPSALPAVIEPYAVVFASEDAVYFTSPVERAPDYGFAGSNWAVCIPPTIVTMDDSDSRIAYSDGWHTVNATGASSGHFRMHNGSSPDHWASLTFTVDAGKTGKLTYSYATSTKGGTADVYMDGAMRTISYSGSTGGIKDPAFGVSTQFTNLTPGSHTLLIKNMTGTVYIDGFVLESGSSTSQPAAGPGATATTSSTLGAGQISTSSLPVASNAKAISVVAEASGGLPVKLLLVSPSGSVLQSADSVNGVAVLTAPVSTAGTYLVKVVNVSVGPVQVWTAATPTVTR